MIMMDLYVLELYKVAKVFLYLYLYVLFRNKFGLPIIFQTEEEGSEVESAAVIGTNDSESNSSSSEVRCSEPEMKQGKCKVL